MVKIDTIETKLLTEKSREDIKNNQISRALLQISTDLECLFFEKLFFEAGIKTNLMRNWTLGRYI